MIDIKDLIKVKTYADKIKRSVTWVYKLADRGEVEIIKIDGVNFIKKK